MTEAQTEVDSPLREDDPVEDTPITPLPMKRLSILCCVLFCESFNITSLFPYVAFMVKDFGLVEHSRDAGYYAGLIASVFCFAQFLSSFVWGILSDKKGRRPILLAGMLGNFVSVLLFGLSRNLAWALCTRALAGLLNGNIPTAKTYLSEITDTTNQASAFTVFGLMWGLGCLVGPFIGGVLAKPASSYPDTFSKDGFFGTYPYFLPNMVSALITLVGFVLGYFYLNETLKKKEEENHDDNTITQQQDIELHHIRTVDDEGLSGQHVKTHNSDATGETDSASDFQLNTRATVDDNNEMNANVEYNLNNQTEVSQPSMLDRLKMRLTNGGHYSKVIENEDTAVVLDTSTHTAKSKDKAKVLRLFCQRDVQICIWLYALLSFGAIIVDEGFPLLAMKPPQDGGLGFESTHIGIVQSVGGIGTIILNVVLYPRLNRRFGTLKLLRSGLILCSLVSVAFPSLHLLASSDLVPTSPADQTDITQLVALADGGGDEKGRHYAISWLLWLYVSTLILLRGMVQTVAFTSTFLVINNCADSESIGTVNGFGQATASLARTVGPAFAGVVFAWSSQGSKPFPFDQSFIFVVACLVLVIGAAITYPLPQSLNNPKSSVSDVASH